MSQLKASSTFTPKQAKVAVCILAAAIAAVDFFLPDNINIASLYFNCIVLLLWARSVRWLWSATAIFILLTFASITLAAAPVEYAVTWAAPSAISSRKRNPTGPARLLRNHDGLRKRHPRTILGGVIFGAVRTMIVRRNAAGGAPLDDARGAFL